VRKFNKVLTIANSGSVGAVFYQPFEMIASDHVTKLESEKCGKHAYLFLASIVKRLGEKYSFNREINDARIKNEKILVPVNGHGEPDYSYMEQYIQNMEYQKLKKYQTYIQDRLECC